LLKNIVYTATSGTRCNKDSFLILKKYLERWTAWLPCTWRPH